MFDYKWTPSDEELLKDQENDESILDKTLFYTTKDDDIKNRELNEYKNEYQNKEFKNREYKDRELNDFNKELKNKEYKDKEFGNFKNRELNDFNNNFDCNIETDLKNIEKIYEYFERDKKEDENILEKLLEFEKKIFQ